MRKWLVMTPLLLLGGIVSWSIATKQQWGPDLLRDSLYTSGRTSLCKAPHISGDTVVTHTQTLGRRSRSEGYEDSWVHTFDVGDRNGGVIDLCSEYGSIRVQGVDGTQGRLLITISDPFPGGARAIADTRVSTSVRRDSVGLRVSVWQQTQGMTTFRSMIAKGARVAALNLLLEVPRGGVYGLSLIANHQRVTVRNVDVRGRIEGYLSPGADLDVGLGGPLALNLNGATLEAEWRRDAGIDFIGGTTATLRPLGPASIEAVLSTGDLALTFVGSDIGLDVLASAKPGLVTVDIGPTETRRADTSGTYARSANYGDAVRKVQVRAISRGGAVLVRRGTQASAQP